MSLNCGIIGLPNVGKSTIFNALSGAGAQMANFPFCTIDPNRGIAAVPDERLLKIAGLLHKEKPIPARMEFVDVAGLVRGASKGEGLGNQFLGNIRNVDAVVHVVRCFPAGEVVHVYGDIDPVRDIDIVNTELLLADLEVLERARHRLEKVAGSGDRDARNRIGLIGKMTAALDEGRSLRTLNLPADELDDVKEYGLISAKPVLYCANVGEDGGEKHADAVRDYARRDGAACILISGRLEEEISELPDGEKQEYLEGMGLGESSLRRLITASHSLLDLITYYTAATDLQAWNLKRGTPAKAAAGKIHTDFEKGFIRAEVVHYDDMAAAGSVAKARDMGLLRSEGRDYVIRDGDIVQYLFSA